MNVQAMLDKMSEFYNSISDEDLKKRLMDAGFEIVPRVFGKPIIYEDLDLGFTEVAVVSSDAYCFSPLLKSEFEISDEFEDAA